MSIKGGKCREWLALGIRGKEKDHSHNRYSWERGEETILLIEENQNTLRKPCPNTGILPI